MSKRLFVDVLAVVFTALAALAVAIAAAPMIFVHLLNLIVKGQW